MATRLDEICLDCTAPERTARWWADALGWTVPVAGPDEAVVVPPDGQPGLPLVFGRVPDGEIGGHRVHLDLASPTPADQGATVRRLQDAGARRIDIGQGDVPWVVLADPDGLPFCVLEPRDDHARAGALAAVVVQAVAPPALARFWAAATGWDVVRSGDGFAGLRPPGTGTGPSLEFVTAAEPKHPALKNRIHLDVAPVAGPRDRDTEVERLLGLGARRIDIGQGDVPWVVLADPEGNELCVLRGEAEG